MSYMLDLEDERDLGRKEGWEEGRYMEKRNIAIKMLRDGYTTGKISEYTELSIDEIESLKCLYK